MHRLSYKFIQEFRVLVFNYRIMTVSELKEKEYDSYTAAYIRKVPGGEFHVELEKSKNRVIAFLLSIPTAKWKSRYAEGKWTIKEIVQHMIDVERVFAYRALRFARNDKTALPGFEVDDYVPPSKANDRPVEDLIQDFKAARTSTQILFKSFPKEMLKNMGTASGSEISVRAAGFKLIGHDIHHCRVMQNRYLSSRLAIGF